MIGTIDEQTAHYILRQAFIERARNMQSLSIVTSNGDVAHFNPNPSKGDENWYRLSNGWESSRNSTEGVIAEIERATGFIVRP